MQTLHMHIEEPPHDIPFFIDRQLWTPLNEWLRLNFPHHSLYLICDDTIESLYGKAAGDHLGKLEHFQGILSFPAGESSKNRQQKAQLEDQLLDQQAGRDTMILAMGGGVTGDLAGYLAATYHRGVPLVHIPTSLLAMVDSSIGGKVGINHPAGKNLLGAFYQPRAVFIDTDFLGTLPPEEFLNGLAEVAKYAATLDHNLYNWMGRLDPDHPEQNRALITSIIARCVELKMNVVEADQREAGYRSVLNFGHTAGHALEQLSGYQLKHGFAVAVGMHIAAWLSHLLLGFPQEEVSRLVALLTQLGLPISPDPTLSADQVWEALQSDKKVRGKIPRFTLLDRRRKPALFIEAPKTEFCHAFQLASSVH